MSIPGGIAAALALMLALTALPPALAAPMGDSPSESTSTTEPALERPDIIPRPNTGSAPTDAGDRGGSLQSGLFVLIIAAIGGIALLVVRASRKARAERGF